MPLALLAEWLLQGGCHPVPDLSPIALNNVQVRQRVALTATTAEIALDVRHGATRMDGPRDIVDASLRLEGDHVVGTVVLGQTGDIPATPLPSDGAGAEAAPTCYQDGRLFHGPAWQMITQIRRNDATAIVVDLAASPNPTSMFAQTRRDRWLLGPSAIDGALQAAILWCQQQHRAPSLPIAWERFDFHVGALAAATTCAVMATGGSVHNGTGIARFDCVWHNQDGQTIASMSGLQMIVDPNLATAFAAAASAMSRALQNLKPFREITTRRYDYECNCCCRPWRRTARLGYPRSGLECHSKRPNGLCSTGSGRWSWDAPVAATVTPDHVRSRNVAAINRPLSIPAASQLDSSLVAGLDPVFPADAASSASSLGGRRTP